MTLVLRPQSTLATRGIVLSRKIQRCMSHSVDVGSKTVFSGIQPTGLPHLGNYLGALRQWKALQDNAGPSDRLIFSLVDLHAITIPQIPVQLRQSKMESLAILLAIGLDPSKCILFHQSQVAAHAELMWILSCHASTGKLGRMTQWKDKTALDSGHRRDTDQNEKLKLGLFSYPVLQAADILLYGATHVPVGEDQAQHLELARHLASSFNNHVGSKVLLPPATWTGDAKRIMDLHDPRKKMSKSNPNPHGRIMLTDGENEIRDKIRRAKTDSVIGIQYAPSERPGISNLIDILHACRYSQAPLSSSPSGDVYAEKVELAQRFAGSSISMLKGEVADAVESVVAPIRETFQALMKDPTTLETVAQQGATEARQIAAPVLYAVKNAVGLL